MTNVPKKGSQKTDRKESEKGDNNNLPSDAAEKEKSAAALTEYLTKEVELHTNLLIAQRTKNNLIFCIAPFVILGVISSNSQVLLGLRKMPMENFTYLIGLIWAAFLFLGFIGAKIEDKLWGQCNEWRRMIAQIHALEGEKGFEFSRSGLVVVYLSIFGTVGSLFGILLYLLKSSI